MFNHENVVVVFFAQIFTKYLCCWFICFRVRMICQRVSNSKTFDLVILLFIGLNCITLAMERPDIPPHSVVYDSLVYIN